MSLSSFFFFFNDTATTEIYTLSLHDALPIYDNRGDVDPAFIDEFPNFRFRFFLALNHIAFALIFREGKIDCWIGNPRPVEFGEQIRLARVGIGQAHGVTGTTMKGVAKMQNLGATFAATSRHVFANLPIHGRL